MVDFSAFSWQEQVITANRSLPLWLHLIGKNSKVKKMKATSPTAIIEEQTQKRKGK